MAQPSIRIDQATPGAGTAGETRVDLILGETILFDDEANVAGTTWVLRGRPVNSTAALTPSGNNVTLVPDLEGMYIVEAVNGPDSSGTENDINEFDSTQGGAGIKLPNGILIPAANEKHQQSLEHGWATSMDFALRQLDTLIGGGGGGGAGTLDEAYDGAGSGAGRTITADSGTVLITNNVDEDDSALAIVRDPPSQTFVSPSGLSITTGVNMLGPALVIFTETSTAENLAIEVTGPTNLTNDGSGSGNTLDVVRAGGTGRALAALSFDDTTHAIRVESAKALEVVQSGALGVGPSIVSVTGADHGSFGGSGLDNTTWEEVTFDLGQTVTHTGGAAAFQYTGMRITGRTLQANAAQTISPSTLVVTAPIASTNVTFSEPWAIASGPMNIGRSDTASGETQDPGLRIERIPATPLTTGQFVHSPHLSLIGIDDSDGTDRYHGFALQTQPDATPGARFALLYQQDTSILSSDSGWSPASPIFSIEHTGDVVMTGPASVTLSSATDGMTIAQSGDGHGLTFNSDTTPTRADVQFTLATANPTTLEVGTLWYVAGATNLLRYYDGTSVVDVGSGGGSGETNLGANVGAGAGLVFRDKTGVTLNFKSLVQGAGIALTNGADDITIAADMSMDETYDNGSTITVDAGAVVLDADTADTSFALEITREPTASAAQGLRVLMGASTTGAGLVIDQNGTGLAADFNGDVDISGKLTVGGLIDPTGLVLVNQASVPGGTPATGETTLWVDSTAKTLMLTDDAGTDFDIQAANGVYVLQAEVTLTGSDDDQDIELGAAGFDGDVIGIVVRSDSARTAGDVTFNAQVAGATTISATLDGTNTQTHAVTATPGTHSFTQGQRLSVNVVEGTGFTPNTTIHVQVHLTNGTVTTTSGGGGSVVHVEDIEVISNTDTVTFSGLDGDTDEIYILHYRIINNSTGALDYQCRPNGVTTGAYSDNYLGGNTNASGKNHLNMGTAGSARDRYSGRVQLFAKRTWGSVASERTFLCHAFVGDIDGSSTSKFTESIAGVWENTADNLTSIEIFGSQTSSIGAGSFFRLQKLQS